MRRRLLLAAALLIALPAFARDGKPKRITVLPSVPQAAAPVAASTTAPAPALAPKAFAPLTSPASADAGQCRAQCAQTRYGCLSGDDNAQCDAPWTRCVVQCGGLLSPDPSALPLG